MLSDDAEGSIASFMERWRQMAMNTEMSIVYTWDSIPEQPMNEGEFKTQLLLKQLQGERVYLAAPYSSKYRHVEMWRVAAATYVANYMMYHGILVNSPITHGDAIYETSRDTGLPLPKDFEFWQEMCLWGIDSADVVVVLKLDGWTESTGVTAEVEYANQQEKDVLSMFPELVPGFCEYMSKWAEKNIKN